MLDIKTFLSRNHLESIESGHHHSRRGWIQTHCPFCSGSKDGFHLGFNLEKGYFHCWRCGKHGFWDTVRALTRTDERQARQLVVECQSSSYTFRPIPKQPKARLREAKPPPDAKCLPFEHQQYLESRGFDMVPLVHTWRITGTKHISGEGKPWSWRVIIPICNETGKVVAYQGRAIGPDVKPKYKMTDDEDCLEDPHGLLYGIDQVDGDSVIIVEGVPGVWRLGTGTVATFGISWRREQANKLRRFKNRYILFDPEPVAQKQAHSLAAHLSLFPGNTEVLSGFTTDPGDFTPKQAAKVRRRLGL